MSVNLPASIDQYPEFLEKIKAIKDQNEKRSIYRYLCRVDLYFLLRYMLGRSDVEHEWLFDRIREVQNGPDDFIDLWAREHYKSTIITFAKTIQDILSSHGEGALIPQEYTFGLFSCTRPLAKGFLRQIKREFESNEELKSLFQDVLYANPQKESPKWSEDDGLVVIRKSNPKESTIEAWGLVDGQPTSKHFNVLVYDDIVTIDSVRTPTMIEKVTEAWELSTNLGAHGGKRRFIGTRYHFNDTWRVILQREVAKPRIYPCTKDGSVDGEPVFLTREQIAQKRRDQGPYTFSCQMLLNPKADETQGFKHEWIKFYDYKGHDGLNVYIIVDPANEKKKTSDYTSISVIGLGSDQNYYKLDMVRDRLSLTERGDALFELHKKWRPIAVGYEKYGMQADISYLKDRMSRENYRFNIVELGGRVSKNDRIKRLVPVYEQGRFYMPKTLYKTNYEGKSEDLIQIFIHQEYLAFPVPVHDDMLDSDCRILDTELGATFPISHTNDNDKYARRNIKQKRGSSWAA